MTVNVRTADYTHRKILITGGAGFIGSNLAERLLNKPQTHVRIFDNLSRGGVSHNVTWLQDLAQSDRLEFVEGDVRDSRSVFEASKDRTEIYHLAAQVAVTTSIADPRSDFEVNATGTLNVLEAARLSPHKPFLLFTSTNKVYGSLDGVPVRIEGTRYHAESATFDGVTELEPLDFHSPYGCSKGAADQYVRDYARIYNLPAVVFRMSCIAGSRQFGTEDQGWVAHLLYSVLERRPITIYGTGFQVRDVLHVDDLVDAMEAAWRCSELCAGRIYNLGGGPRNSVSVLEMVHAISRETGVEPTQSYSALRPGDQPFYVSDTSKFNSHTGWSPRHDISDVLRSVFAFWEANAALLSHQRGSVESHMHVTEEVA